MPNATYDQDRLCLRPELLRPGHRLTLHRDGGEAYPRMLAAIRGARHSVLLEMYTFAGDATGRIFADALAGGASAGLDVRVLYDAVGSRTTPGSFFGELRARGVKVAEFHPLARWLAGFGLGRRNHRKLLVVDGRVAFIGGLNISNEYAATAEGGLGWRDTLVEIEGPSVLDQLRTFMDLWTRIRRNDPPLPVVPEGPALQASQARPAGAGSGSARVLTVSSQRRRDRWEIARHYRHAIEQARDSVWIASAYFLPSLRFTRSLRAARRRGVDVRLLLPGRTDFAPVLYGMQRLFTSHLLAGLRIFEWPGPMMHAKTMVVDGTWSTVGS
ncbi:MAG TPA: phosphatidylserine/phosphatidylglycerophosphate/cardiolipin synthase family protein, partial [Planctomycetota bacterium]|nr:phosphatidylserine/phosphatidylglycerophosphate/cardiolipin synthase family protein [Planctomycetota bacterium]